MNRTGIALTVVALVLAGGALVASGAHLPLVAGPGYHPGSDVTDTAASTDVATDGDAGEGPTPTEGRYDHATVTVFDENGTALGVVSVAVADTPNKRYVGLSKTESLPKDHGMLFTYSSEADHTYVMRNMDFGLDIVYIDANGTVRTVHHAREPPEGADGEEYRYPGRGKYVLEVNHGWTDRHDVDPGDRIRIDGLESG